MSVLTQFLFASHIVPCTASCLKVRPTTTGEVLESSLGWALGSRRWVLGGWVLGGWVLSGWVLGGWVLGGWVLGGWVLGGWVLGG